MGARNGSLEMGARIGSISNPSMSGLIFDRSSASEVIRTRQSFSPNQLHTALKMDLNNEYKSLLKQGLSVAYFGKDLHKFGKGSKDCTIFCVLTRSDGDEIYYPEGDVDTLGNWIRCGDPTGLPPEWRDVNASDYKLKVYLAGENPGIDCTSVMDDMFANEGAESYTYVLSRETKKVITKITHPQDYFNLS
jgi:hypothetical protein